MPGFLPAALSDCKTSRTNHSRPSTFGHQGLPATTIAGRVSMGAQLRLRPEKGGTLTLNGMPYRGALIIRRDLGIRLTVINELEMDLYLYGILPKEVSADWHPESLVPCGSELNPNFCDPTFEIRSMRFEI